MTVGVKKLKVRCGRISRVLNLPAGIHGRVKELARSQSTSAASIYDLAVRSFFEEKLPAKHQIEYLYPQGKVEKINIPFKEEVVTEMIKVLSERDSVSENRVIYTAIIRFSKKLVDSS